MIGKGRLLRGAGYVALGLVLFVLFLVFTMPASWLAVAAERFSDGVIRIHSPTGTIWSGNGELDVGGPAITAQHLGKIRWRLNPLWLFAGRAQLSLQVDGAVKANARVRLSPGKYVVQQLDASFPVRLVSLAYAPAAFFQPTGNIDIRSGEVELSRSGLTGIAEANWRGAGGRFTQGTLGDYKIELQGVGKDATIRLSTVSGRLRLEGQGKWDIAGSGELQFNGTAAPASDHASLEPLLQPMGPDLGGGRRALRFATRLSAQELGL
jgi:general secretion pathway protein N